MTSLIDTLNSVLANLKTELELVLTEYSVKTYLRFPTSSDKFPICFIVPIKVTPSYQGGLSQLDEYATIEIQLHLVTKVPFDYQKSTLLEDLDTALEKLRTLRFDTTKWRELQYTDGVELEYSPIENWILQSAVINLRIEE